MENFKTQFVTLNVLKASFFLILLVKTGRPFFGYGMKAIFRSKHEGHIWVKA